MGDSKNLSKGLRKIKVKTRESVHLLGRFCKIPTHLGLRKIKSFTMQSKVFHQVKAGILTPWATLIIKPNLSRK